MGGILSLSDKVGPKEISEIKSFPRSDSEISHDLENKNRSTTDVCFLIFFVIFLIVLLCFLGYCIFNGDIYRVLNGYDNCGNVCGKTNYNLRSVNRSTDDCPESDRTTVPKCLKIFNFAGKNFLYLCLISLVFSILILVLFRYLVGFVVWIVLLSTIIACLTGTVILWIMWKSSRDDNDTKPLYFIPEIDSRKTETYLAFAILATLATVIVALIIFVMRKRIKLVVQLFEESGKAIAAMPELLAEPILTFIFLAVTISLWFYFCLWIASSGTLTEKRPHVYYYEKDGWMKFTRWYNFFAMLWMAQFLIGCQHMVIAGAVASWYFKRDKSTLKRPIFRSAYNLTRYHLGSIALGSFVIAFVQFVRVILKAVEKYLNKKEGKCVECMLKCCHCCLYCFETILKYLSRNAYIEVAIHGYSFCSAGKQAFKLLSSNVLRVVAINSVGDFVLFLGKVFVVIATVLIGIEMFKNKDGVQHIWVPITLSGLFAYFVAHCFMTVYEMTIDTIFLCFCEDCEMNDGISRPYYMSRGLMEFVENSKKALDVHDARNRIGSDRNISTISGVVGRHNPE